MVSEYSSVDGYLEGSSPSIVITSGSTVNEAEQASLLGYVWGFQNLFSHELSTQEAPKDRNCISFS